MAIIGPSGAGKTSLLRLLGTELRGEGRLTLWDQGPGPSPGTASGCAAGSAWSGSNRRCPPPSRW